MVVQTRHSGRQEIGDELREEERRLLGPVIQRKLGVTDTLCQAVGSTFVTLAQASSVVHVVS